MAAQRWTAKLFVNSEVGEIDAEVYAATLPGARQQIRAKYGDVQSIYNLNAQGPAGSGGGSGSSMGCLPVFGLLALVVIAGVFGGGSDDTAPVESRQAAPVERVQATPVPTAEPQFRDYASPPPSYCITENFEPC